jgi:4-diphosphocytidyl-2C-methyl-D-erythritol kinase
MEMSPKQDIRRPSSIAVQRTSGVHKLVQRVSIVNQSDQVSLNNMSDDELDEVTPDLFIAEGLDHG